jgi:hypothetical protein
MFHTQSEEDVMFPEVLRISSGSSGPQQLQLDTVLAACTTCQDEHTSEVGVVAPNAWTLHHNVLCSWGIVAYQLHSYTETCMP